MIKQKKERHVMTMKDWINIKKLLDNSKNIYVKNGRKSENKYEKYRVIKEQKYISSMMSFIINI